VERLKKIIQGCLDNERQAQNELYKHFAGTMYGICLRYASDQFEAQDILQEGFVKVFKSLNEFRGNGSFEGWMKRIFVNHALEKYRSRLSFVAFDDIENGESGYINDGYSPMDALSAKEILVLVQQLPDQYRVVFNLFVIEGLSHSEIAETLNIAESTSRSNLTRAKSILKEKIGFNSKLVERAI